LQKKTQDPRVPYQTLTLDNFLDRAFFHKVNNAMERPCIGLLEYICKFQFFAVVFKKKNFQKKKKKISKIFFSAINMQN
jgi:hypothetical protein